MRKPGSIFLLAVFIGALAAAMVYRHLRDLRAQMDTARPSNSAMVDVVVANAPIPIGTRIEEGAVRTVSWPADVQPEGVLKDPKQAVGSVVRASVARNTPITQSDLVPPGAGILPLMIDEGMRGMSVRVDDVTGVSGFITPNSHVDVLIAGNPDQNGDGQQRSKVVLQNIKVLATGKTVELKDDKPVEAPTVTLLVSPDEAEKLTLATRYEPLRLALRNYQDEEFVRTPGASTRVLFDGQVAPPVAMPSAPAAERVREPAPYTVEILMGETLTKQPIL